jgi:hypothetical protein
MRRSDLRARENILKRQRIHVSAFNLSLILGKLRAAGTPRELRNRAGRSVFAASCSFLVGVMTAGLLTRHLLPLASRSNHLAAAVYVVLIADLILTALQAFEIGSKLNFLRNGFQ